MGAQAAHFVARSALRLRTDGSDSYPRLAAPPRITASNLLTNYPTFCQQFVRVRYDALVLCAGGASSLYPRP